MEAYFSEVGMYKHLRTAQQGALYNLAPRIRDEVKYYAEHGQEGVLFVPMACFCCDSDKFNFNKDVPRTTTHILCPVLSTDTYEYDRGRKVFKMNRPLPRALNYNLTLKSIFRGPEKIILDEGDVTEYFKVLHTLLTQITGYHAN